MKTTNLEVAKKLAKILNKPLEDFYEQPEDQDSEQEIEEEVEAEQEDSSNEVVDDVQEIQDSEERPVRTIPGTVSRRDTSKDADYIKLYGGSMSDNGKLIGNHRQMTRKEYIAATKNLTDKGILDSPLLFLMFRAEGQVEGHFVQWLEGFKE